MPSDPKGRDEPGHRIHVFVCGHERASDALRESCGAKGSLAIMKKLKTAAKGDALAGVRVQKSGCLDFCENGISCVVYPEGIWYSIREPEVDLPAILAHLGGGGIADRCLMRFEDSTDGS